ncbi:LlaJI family restriction endonuclease [Aliarcobacter butzleri]|nr:LlaJI family restriction endonuclease [Aliarcobacter butzleri]
MSSLKFYIEEEKYSNIDISQNFSNTDIEKLKELGILKKLENNDFKFSYTGILSLNSNLYLFLPKYLIYRNDLDEQEKIEELKIVLKVLKKYAKKNQFQGELSFLTFDDSNDNFSLLAIVEYLIEDFINYGLYNRQISDIEYNGDGIINWLNTVENELIYKSNNQVIYLDYLNDITYDFDNYITKLHKLVLNKSFHFMQSLEFLELFDFPIINFEIEENSLGSISFQIKKINDELSISFSQREVKLLKALKLFIEHTKTSNGYENDFFYGTCSFNMVWEKICSDIIGTDRNKLLPFGSETKELIEFIPYPIWNERISLVDKNASRTLNPDILKIYNCDELFIFDAKYYKPIFKDSILQNGNPGVEDISKQYLYELAFKNMFSCRFNLFVFPVYDKKNEIIGKVKFNLFDMMSLNSIYLLELNTLEVYHLYLEEKRYSNDFFIYIKDSIASY